MRLSNSGGIVLGEQFKRSVNEVATLLSCDQLPAPSSFNGLYSFESGIYHRTVVMGRILL